MTLLFFALGLGALVLGAELLVRGASRLALSIGISPLVVGLTVVAFGTSAPELAVSVQSAWSGQVDIAIGNVVGSNILNILAILGLSALIVPLVVHQQVVRQEVPILIAASLLMWWFAADGAVGRTGGAVFFLLLVFYTVFVIRQSRRETAAVRAEYAQEIVGEEPDGWDRHWAVQVLLVVGGLALLVLGARWLVDASVAFARYLGVSELVIGLTIVAAGTSLPEVATSVLAAVRGERDIAVGNAIGSNLFNILAVLGASALTAPRSLTVAPSVLAFDLPVMTAVAVACLPIFFRGYRISRGEGLFFLSGYVAYATYLVLSATRHHALSTYSLVMGAFVLPLAVVTLAVLTWRHWRARGESSGA